MKEEGWLLQTFWAAAGQKERAAAAGAEGVTEVRVGAPQHELAAGGAFVAGVTAAGAAAAAAFALGYTHPG